MSCSKKMGKKETTNFARSVYYLATLVITLFTLPSQAQLLDLSTLPIYQYEGISEVLGGRPCIVKASPLSKNFLGRLGQQFELLTLEADGRSVKRRHVLKLNPLTKHKAPATCNRKTKACLWEFVVSKVHIDKADADETFFLSLESYVKAPDKFYLISLLKKGSASGAKRLHWDCVVQKAKENVAPRAIIVEE